MNLIPRARRKLAFLLIRLVQYSRCLLGALLATAEVRGSPKLLQPTYFAGVGRIEFGKGVCIGVFPSPDYLTGSCHIEARSSSATISIGDNTVINNSFAAIAEGTRIEIGKNCLIGPRVTIFDSDFHALSADDRKIEDQPAQAPVIIGDDVFIGAGVFVLKGAIIGDGAVIGAGAVVNREVPARVVVAGNPAKVVGKAVRKS